MLHRAGDPANGQKVFIAVAAYQDCGAGFTYALFHTGAALAKAGIGYELAIYSGNVHVDDSRNRLTRDFLNSDCTDMVFLDADVAWNASDFLKLLSFDRDVVAGVYPKKNGDDTYPVKLIPGEQWSDAAGLIEVQGVPTGFLRIRRQVMEALATASERYNAKNDQAFATACIFERQIHNGSRWGGDYVFCRKARAAGFSIFIDPVMRFEHSGEETWSGNVGQYLRQRYGIGLKSGLDAISAGRERVEDLLDLFDAWANPYAASPLLLGALAPLARNARTIVECGGGLSTVVMAAANPNADIHTLEDNPVFADHLAGELKRYGLANVTIHCKPLVGGWYDMAGLPSLDGALVFIDGPRRSTASRADAPEHMDLARSIVVADDVQDDGGVPALRAVLSVTHDIIFIADSARRGFAIGMPKAVAQSEAA